MGTAGGKLPLCLGLSGKEQGAHDRRRHIQPDFEQGAPRLRNAIALRPIRVVFAFRHLARSLPVIAAVAQMITRPDDYPRP